MASIRLSVPQTRHRPPSTSSGSTSMCSQRNGRGSQVPSQCGSRHGYRARRVQLGEGPGHGRRFHLNDRRASASASAGARSCSSRMASATALAIDSAYLARSASDRSSQPVLGVCPARRPLSAAPAPGQGGSDQKGIWPGAGCQWRNVHLRHYVRNRQFAGRGFTVSVEMTRLNFELDNELHRRAKAAAALEGRSMKAWVEEAIAEKLARPTTRPARRRRASSAGDGPGRPVALGAALWAVVTPRGGGGDRRGGAARRGGRACTGRDQPLRDHTVITSGPGSAVTAARDVTADRHNRWSRLPERHAPS